MFFTVEVTKSDGETTIRTPPKLHDEAQLLRTVLIQEFTPEGLATPYSVSELIAVETA